ncbi:MAG: hypothetical protein ITF98_00245 [Fermentimonas sp.]|nr:hypothetical protein [Fermentimonas sp.]
MKKTELYELIDIHISESLQNSLKDKSNVDSPGLKLNHELIVEDLEDIVIEYPYFQTARLLYTIELQNNNQNLFIEELAKTAVLCADRKRLFYLIQPDNYREFTRLTKSILDNKDRTEELLDSYFKTFIEKPTELSFAPSEYFSYLESLGEETTGGEDSTETTQNDYHLQHQDIIDAFIEKNESDTLNRIQFTKKTSNPTTIIEELTDSPKKDDDSEFLTETLAKIYIKQKKYDKALAIIKQLSLNYPKKSAYFADQIRFLEYLIMNDKKNN